jgi:hypothetical protein
MHCWEQGASRWKQHASARPALSGFCLTGSRLLVWTLGLLLTLAACGGSTQRAALVPTSSGLLVCGSISGSGADPQVRSPRGEDPRPAEACFWQAFRACQPARLDYWYFAIDTGTIHHFRIRSEQGKCLLSDAVSRYTVPRPPQPATVYPCRAVAREQRSYRVVGCGVEGDIPLPLLNT